MNTNFGTAISTTDAQSTRESRRATSYACTYGDTNTVTYLVRTGRGIDGLCTPCAERYGYPQYLVPVTAPRLSTGRESTVTLPGFDGTEITETATIRVILDRITCGWCHLPARYAVTLTDWTDYACTTHAHEWFAPHFPVILVCEFTNLCGGSTNNVLAVRIIHSNGTETYANACASCRSEAHTAHAIKATSVRMELEFSSDHDRTTVPTDSPFCPSVWTGCHHTMVQSEDGYGVACYEYATMNGTYARP